MCIIEDHSSRAHSFLSAGLALRLLRRPFSGLVLEHLRPATGKECDPSSAHVLAETDFVLGLKGWDTKE